MAKRTDPIIESIYKDDDGWWVAYKPGWKSSTDPVGELHSEHEDTKRQVMALVRKAMRCDCVDCQIGLMATGK